MIPLNDDMRFEVTTKCNYDCVICPRDLLIRKKETMSLDLFKLLFDKIVAETDRCTTLTISGMGEPLLDETLDQKIEYAKQRRPDLDVLMLTNGSLMSIDKFKQLERLGLTSIRVSIYGNDPDSYCRVHGVKDRGMFERVRNNILAYLKSRTTTKILLTLNVIKGYNEHIMKDWIAYWEDKVDLIEVWRPHNWGMAKKCRKVQKKKLKTCGRPFLGPLEIQVDGKVNMCCCDFNGDLIIGDLKTQTLQEIFSSPAYCKIVECHKTGNFTGSGLICEGCDFRNADKSGVMLYNSKFDIEQRVKMTSTTYAKIIDEDSQDKA